MIFARNYEKMILGTSDAWSTSHLSQRTSEPAYYIIDCQISGLMTRRTGLKLRSDLKWIVNCKGQEISVGNCSVYNSPKKQSLFFHLNTFFGELITPQIFF